MANRIDTLSNIIKLSEEGPRLLGIRLFDWWDFSSLFFRCSFNLIILLVIMHFFYLSKGGKKDYLFTNVLIGMVVFILCFLLESVKLQLGFALGLFAVFGIIRYRTDTIPIREMTYLFCVIGLSILNALSNKKVSYLELMFSNTAVLFTIFLLEKWWMNRKESSKQIIYEKIELIKEDRREDLVQDLKERTGLDITRVCVGNIDFLKDTAELEVYYYMNGDNNNESQSSKT